MLLICLSAGIKDKRRRAGRWRSRQRVKYSRSFPSFICVDDAVAYYNDVCVGAVCCRLESDEDSDKKKLYIMTLGVLSPYRRLGLGKELLEHILKEVGNKEHDISKVYLHVQINNDAAVEFYKKHGFQVTQTQQDYYKNVEPRDAYVLEKVL
ncbi:acyl-CoA N-acyltransferase [Hesseltinella vesiculosa]|uniref:N-terminal methionine N(alpha)-acetyltransferase NatE n=1 Tax=Hesseltinella vesiculosa TaxID=101127 RepID=A0A1X2GCW8_9FUNG|nr:acyl-CoA N-acyltransferase [Hesseltinella vesiculosa]